MTMEFHELKGPKTRVVRTLGRVRGRPDVRVPTSGDLEKN
jgi:hypothetical protein